MCITKQIHNEVSIIPPAREFGEKFSLASTFALCIGRITIYNIVYLEYRHTLIFRKFSDVEMGGLKS